MHLNWGIVTAGRICSDFVTAINHHCSKSDHTLQAVAARNLERAQEFSKKHNIATAYSSYEELSHDNKVNIVYIGSLTAHHFEHCKLFLNAGKHVLCEKTLVLSLKQTEELIALAKEKKLFLQEAVWSRFTPIYREIRKQLASGALGEVKVATATFAVNIRGVERLTSNELGGGSLMDLGIYPIQLVLMVFGSYPTAIKATGSLSETGVDEQVSVSLQFGDGRVGHIYFSSVLTLPCVAYVGGSKATIAVGDPAHAPTSIEITETAPSQSVKKPQVIEIIAPVGGEYNFGNSSLFCFEADEVKKALEEGKQCCDDYDWEEMLKVHRVQAEISKQIGLKFVELKE